MPPSKPTFLTLPREIRDKILGHTIDMGEELQVCICPEYLKNSLGLCDFRRMAEQGQQESITFTIVESGNISINMKKRQTFKLPENPATSLALVCRQLKEEIYTFRIELPTLVFCQDRCLGKFVEQYEDCRIFNSVHRIKIHLSEEVDEQKTSQLDLSIQSDAEYLELMLKGMYELTMVATKTNRVQLDTSDGVKMADSREYIFERQPVPVVEEPSWIDML